MKLTHISGVQPRMVLRARRITGKAARILILAATLLMLALPAAAQEPQTILHLLDYIGVDYAEAVEDGRIKNTDEYKEMLEFAAQVETRLQALPEHARKRELAAEASALAKLVADKQTPAAVATAAGKLRWAIVEAYRLRLAPRGAPDLRAGAALYAKLCAACHGAEGRGDGPAAKGLDPAPSSFHDLERMAQRSAYGLYNTIALGVEGTSMAAFGALDENERWALAFYVANVGIPSARRQEGERLWRTGEARQAFPDLDNVAMLSTVEVVARYGENAARVQDYLRAHPDVLRPLPLAYARQKLAEALEALRRGDRAGAMDAATTAYLEGFELTEASLANVDAALMREIEREMMALRAAIGRGEAEAEFNRRVDRIQGLLDRAQAALGAGELSPASAFVASLVILLREGLEAILVLAAIIAFVTRTGRGDALRFVHAGWIAALALGALTWIAATYLFEISGANRELTEGVTALAAAAMLLYVGWWLHGKAYAQAWARFIEAQVGQALARRTLWALAAVSFFAVYREIFEIVLFYQALWVQAGTSGRDGVLAGIAAGAVLLAAIGLGLLKFGVRLPLGRFFGWTSLLLLALAVVFVGHGVRALQEAGVVGATALGFSPVELLGLYPSRETVAAQVGVLLIAIAALLQTRMRQRPAGGSEPL